MRTDDYPEKAEMRHVEENDEESPINPDKSKTWLNFF